MTTFMIPEKYACVRCKTVLVQHVDKLLGGPWIIYGRCPNTPWYNLLLKWGASLALSGPPHTTQGEYYPGERPPPTSPPPRATSKQGLEEKLLRDLVAAAEVHRGVGGGHLGCTLCRAVDALRALDD